MTLKKWVYGQLANKVFLNWIRNRRGRISFPIATINLLSLKRIGDSDVKNNFVIMKVKQVLNIFLASIPVPK